MNTELEMIYTLRELRSLYKMGELREVDFNERIRDLETLVERFEQEFADEQHI